MGGAATFYERALERWLDNKFPSTEMGLGIRSYADEWTHVDPAETLHFRAFVQNRPLQEREVFPVGHQIEVEIRFDAMGGQRGFEISIEPGGVSLKESAPRQYQIQARCPMDCFLIIKAGHFSKRYRLTFFKSMNAREAEMLEDSLGNLAINANSWDQETLTSFRKSLASISHKKVSREVYPAIKQVVAKQKHTTRDVFNRTAIIRVFKY